MGALICVVAWLGADLLLLIVGPSYSGLRHEMLLSVATSGIAVLASYGFWVNAARSWKRWQLPLTAVSVAFQVVSAG